MPHNTDSAKKVAIIVFSHRAVRIGPEVGDIVKKAIEKDADDAKIEISMVDVVKFNLPVYNEAPAPFSVPKHAQFQFDYTKRWSEEISKYDGYILILNEYNWGVSGAAKNAIDYLANEWRGKPVTIVSYGINGGNLASDQMKVTLTNMGLHVTDTRPQLAFRGNGGPDLLVAMGEGKVAPDSKKDWEGQADRFLSAFGQLKGWMEQPPAKVEAAK